ncbi:unnamed protein product [Caenorhabditis sp. 36 PRJEB53466]|nr:unnamed protein product [Caenorhabditis sp. 36 PRJEB53466]
MHTLTSIEVPLHIFGAYIIIFKTPKSMDSARTIIFIVHTLCSVMDIYCTFFLVFVFWVPSPSGYPVGFLSTLGVSSTIQTFIFFNTLLATGIGFIGLFENRHDTLVIGQSGRSESRNFKRFLFFALTFFICASDIVYVFMSLPDVEIGRISVQKQQPCIPMSLINNPGFIHLNIDNYLIPMLTGIIITALFLQGSFFVIYTIHNLFFAVRIVSKTTQRMQRKFFVAMILQALIPVTSIVIPMYYLYLAWSFSYYNQKYNNFAEIAFGMNGFFTTIVMIIVHQPYRKAVKNMFTGTTSDDIGSKIFRKISVVRTAFVSS